MKTKFKPGADNLPDAIEHKGKWAITFFYKRPFEHSAFDPRTTPHRFNSKAKAEAFIIDIETNMIAKHKGAYLYSHAIPMPVRE